MNIDPQAFRSPPEGRFATLKNTANFSIKLKPKTMLGKPNPSLSINSATIRVRVSVSKDLLSKICLRLENGYSLSGMIYTLFHTWNRKHKHWKWFWAVRWRWIRWCSNGLANSTNPHSEVKVAMKLLVGWYRNIVVRPWGIKIYKTSDCRKPSYRLEGIYRFHYCY